MTRLTALTRRFALALLAAAALFAHGASADSGAGLGKVRGDARAKVTIIEYASPTCAHCKSFHDTYAPILMKEFVDTGKVRFEMREVIFNDIDTSIAALARCSGKNETWFAVMDDAFANQPDIIAAAKSGTVKPVLMQLASRHGITTEAAFDACVKNVNTRFDLAALRKSEDEYGVKSTPTLIVNGVKKANGPDLATPEAFRAWLTTLTAPPATPPKKQKTRKR